MKSLLVDVLREAQGESAAPEAPSAAPKGEQESDRSAPPVPARADDLDLMATGEYATTGKALGSSADESLSDDLQRDGEQDRAEAASDADQSAMPAERVYDTSILHDMGARLTTQTPVILRIGRLTPVICLLAASGVAASYLFFTRATSSSLNESLNEMADIVQAGGRSDPVQRLDQPTNMFTLATIPEPVAPAVEEAPVSQRSVASSRDAVNDPAVATDNAPVVVSRSLIEDAVEDRAFDLVAGGYTAYQRRDFEAAEAAYQAALTIEPNHRDALLGIAAVYRQTDRDPAALEAYRRVLQIEPGNIIAASAILSVQSTDAEWDSESELKLLLQQYPQAHHLHFALGTAYVGKARWAEARRSFAAANRLAPDNANYLYNLAVACEHLGELVSAAQYYEETLAFADESSVVDRAAVQAHLDQLSMIARDDR